MTAQNRVDLLNSSPAELDQGLENHGFDANSTNNLDGGDRPRRAVVQFMVDEKLREVVGVNNDQTNTYKAKGYPRSIHLSTLYCITLVLVGLVAPTTEALTDVWISSHVVGAFLVYLYSLSIIFLIYVQCYQLRKHKQHSHEIRKKMIQNRQKQLSAFPTEGPTSSVSPRIRVDSGGETLSRTSSVMSLDLEKRNSVAETDLCTSVADTDVSYQKTVTEFDSVSFLDIHEDVQEYIIMKHGTATMSHEGTSFYLRLGCLLFAIGNLILVALKIEHEYSDNVSTECKKYTLKYTNILHLVFIIVQTFFLFKTHSLVVRQHKAFVRFGLMHVLATNLCVWLRIMVEEIMHGIEDHVNHIEDYEKYKDLHNNTNCGEYTNLLAKASPFLFPFVLEYSLIAVATMASLFAAMNVQVTKDIIDTVRKALRQAYRKGEDLLENHLHYETGGFDKAHQGTFLGMVVMSGVLVSTVLFHYWSENDATVTRADMTFQVSDLIINVILFIGIIVGMIRLYPLSYDLNRENTIDHYLLISSMMGLILLELFSMAGTFIARENHSVGQEDHILLLNTISGSIGITQALLQAIFITDGMQKISVSEQQRKEKPGRGTISFLLVANVAAWVFKSFQEKSLAIQEEKAVFGDIAWPLILDITLPLLLFFRFHSSICLADMWHSVYEPEESVIETQFLS